jgi:hypothetical protein
MQRSSSGSSLAVAIVGAISSYYFLSREPEFKFGDVGCNIELAGEGLRGILTPTFNVSEYGEIKNVGSGTAHDAMIEFKCRSDHHLIAYSEDYLGDISPNEERSFSLSFKVSGTDADLLDSAQNVVIIKCKEGTFISSSFDQKPIPLQEKPITFPDPNLEREIRKSIDKPNGPIYMTDLIELTELCTAYKDITDLTGLEFCINLTALILSNNQISDLSPLSSLTKIRFLDLPNNQISDLSPLSSLTEVFHLDLSNNQISDIKPLLDMDLYWLNLENNPLSGTSIEVYIPKFRQKRGKRLEISY